MNQKWEYLKQLYLDAYDEAVKSGKINVYQNGIYTFKMLQALRDMAKNDVYPDISDFRMKSVTYGVCLGKFLGVSLIITGSFLFAKTKEKK